MSNSISDNDKSILRGLASEFISILGEPEMEERRRLWKAQKGLKGERPMLLVETAAVLSEIHSKDSFVCQGEDARSIELGLRDALFRCKVVKDDWAPMPRFTYGTPVKKSGWGVDIVRHYSDDNLAGNPNGGSFIYETPLKDLPKDISKLQVQEYEIDRGAAQTALELQNDLFGNIAPVINRNSYWWTQGMTGEAIELIGLENLMTAMYDEPEALHQLMAFLRDDHLKFIDFLEANNLLSPNNEDDYIGSGSIGYTDELPSTVPAKPKDMWVLCESQETVGVSPKMYEEFVFQYEKPIVEKFGLSYYGCCEPVHSRWHVLKKFSNLRCVSVSPWADQKAMVENLGNDYVFSRKPNPTLVSAGWDEAAIRADLLETVTLTKGMNVEIILKDVHTISHEPHRLGRWVEIARETIEQVYG